MDGDGGAVSIEFVSRSSDRAVRQRFVQRNAHLVDPAVLIAHDLGDALHA
jgi:hypothetical protein